ATLMLSETEANVKALGARLSVSKAAKELIIDKSYTPRYGARPIRREIQRSIEDPLSEIILAADDISGAEITVDKVDGEISVSVAD
ncbi:MAG: Clp protease ClpC, partial [Clostridia bacterium]|nr:Clp protease ClpC [Clostridia bacterium]